MNASSRGGHDQRRPTSAAPRSRRHSQDQPGQTRTSTISTCCACCCRATPRAAGSASASRRSRRACWRRRRRRPAAPDPGPATPPTPAPAESSRPRESRPAAPPRDSARDRAETGTRGPARCDGLIGQYGSDCVSSARSTPSPRRRQLTPRQRHARPRQVARHRRTQAAADAEADQKHRQDQREGVDRRAEQQRQDPRPDHFGRERGHARQRNRHDRPPTRPAPAHARRVRSTRPRGALRRRHGNRRPRATTTFNATAT